MAKNQNENEEKKTRQVVYNPRDPGDPVAVDAYGKRFVAGVPVELDEEHHEKVRGNRHFSFEGQDKAKEEEEQGKRNDEQAKKEAEAIMQRKRDELDQRQKAERDQLDARQKAERERLEMPVADKPAGFTSNKGTLPPMPEAKKSLPLGPDDRRADQGDQPAKSKALA